MIYKRNFLKSVIFRIDFDKIELGKLKVFLDKISKTFPLIEEEKGEEGTISFDLKTKELKQVSNALTSWNIYNKTKTIRIKIHSSFLTIEYFNYKDSSELLSNIGIIADFLKDFGVKTINRLGLRYINEIKIEGKDPLDWSIYINEKLLGLTSFAIGNKKMVARAMGFIVFKEEFGDINFNYGLWNSAYPSAIAERVFILDFDGYSRFPLDTEGIDLGSLVKEYNGKIEELFEKSIKEDLRKVLNKFNERL